MEKFELNKIILDMKGGSDKEAAALKEKILNAKDELVITGKKYHISNNGNDNNDGLTSETAWATFDKFHAMKDTLEPGDAVLMERGSTWRVYKDLPMLTGVTYAAYGEGPKPCLMGSDRNYANPEFWHKTVTKNVWYCEYPRDARAVGNIVFNLNQYVGWKCRGKDKLAKDLDFYDDRIGKTIYLYFTEGNPGEYFDDIEFCLRFTFISCWDDHTHDVTIDNLCLKYNSGGAIATATGGNHDITITNCEISFMGGDFLGDDVTTCARGGNGIGMWADQKNILIKNNWIYQGYDAGISPQGSPYMINEDMQVIDNLIEYCTWSYEAWVSPNYGQFIRHIFKGNIMRFAGYGWAATQRPAPQWTSHYNGFLRHQAGCWVDCLYEDNILDISSWYLVAWNWTDGPKEHPGFKVRNNTFYQKENDNHRAMKFGFHEVYAGTIKTAYCQADLEEAVKCFDPEPKLVKWFPKEYN
ncbi:MAG: right-handed parallel beta-helix repeat-containing protein [Ruminococcaceae bacterium]|nr:right-handed parallel beta-helix repeat-containing protein [Oscillospiraceae bacterium]